MPDGFTFAADDKAGGAAPSGKSAFSWDADDPTHSQALARVAQPTEFEKSAAASGASATPWTDTARGFGQRLMGTAALAGRAIHAIPGVGPALIPSQGLAAEQKMSIPHTPGEKLGSNIEGVAEAALPIGEVADVVKGSKYVRPAAQFLAENVIPEIKSLPYVGRGIEAAENAPTLVKAAIRGGTTGATLGALEQAVRTRDLGETAKGALYGGAGGAILGMGAHGINRLAGAGAAAEIPAVSEEPFELTPPPQPTEPAIQQRMEFPTASEIAFRTDANGTRWARLPDSPAEVSIPKNLSGGDAQKYAQDKLELQSNFAKDRAQIPATPAPGKTGPMLQRMGDLIQQGAGTPPEIPTLQSNVPLRAQIPSAGQKVSDILNQNTEQEAVRPLSAGPQKGMTLSEIAEAGPPAEAVPHRATVTHEGKTFGMEAANGRKMYEATQGDTALAKAVHDMKNAEVTRAFTNGGGDVRTVGMEGQRYKVGNTTSNERGQQFEWLLNQGYTPREIIDLAKQSPGSIPTLAKPGRFKPMKYQTIGERAKREKAGD